MINAKTDCVHYRQRGNRCTLTTHDDCTKCTFYMTQEQWEEMRKKYPIYDDYTNSKGR